MAKESRIPLTVMANTSPLRKPAGSILHWDGRSDACRDLGTNTVSKHEQQSSFQAKGPLATERRVQRYWTTEEIRLVPAVSLQTIIWEQEAELTLNDMRPLDTLKERSLGDSHRTNCDAQPPTLRNI